MKRDVRLHGLSSEHHHALVLARTLSRAAWNAAEGEALHRKWIDELEPHFRTEEQVMLPALLEAGRADLVERTLADHAEMRALLERARVGDEAAARSLGERLTEHVRFEERDLFVAAEELLGGTILDEIAHRSPKKP